jgi:hypothetical protein
MADAPFMISPAGFIVDVDFSGSAPPGLGNMGNPIVTPLLPGAAVQARGTGEHPLSYQLNGRRGTLEAYFVTGALGADRMIAMLTDSRGVIGIGVDSGNQPFGIIWDGLGNPVSTITLPLGSLPAGTPMTVRLVWDSNNPTMIIETRTVAAISHEVVATWGSFVPISLWLGGSSGIVPYADFNGVIHKIQVSNLVLPQAVSVVFVEETAFVHAVLTAHSSVGADLQLVPMFTGLLGSPFSMGGHVVPGL